MKYFVLTTAAALTAVSLGVSAAVPVVSPEVKAAAEAFMADPRVDAMYKEMASEAGQKERFNMLMELVRIASPSRFEMRRQAEITKRLVNDWGFAQTDIMTTPSGYLKGAGVQTVDGKPVYNVCVRIPGSYATRPDAKSYKGQFPKVLFEGHIDTVNPAELPPADKPFVPVKLQKVNKPIVKNPAELAAIADELHFDAKGHVIEDEAYQRAYKRFNNLDEAKKADAYRIYVTGYSDAMVNTVSVLYAAKMMKKYGIKPVYDVWFCGTTGEEGKGNLCGMKQLYGYSQEAGKGNNALNFVANIAADSTSPGSSTVNYLGSYRFEMKFSERAGFKVGDKARPSAVSAVSRATAAIAGIKTSYDLDKKAERTTYTVGVVRCSDPAAGSIRSSECTMMVDMRSPTPGPLNAIRAQIEPQFQKAVDAENAKYGVKAGSSDAVKLDLVWFGDRPAYRRTNYNDIVLQSFWTATNTIGIDQRKELSEASYSLNDNVPAAVGVPTINMNMGTVADNGGGHTWYEYGMPGNGVDEAKRILRFMMTGLLVSGFETKDGKTVEPGTGPIGARTTEEMFK